MLFLTEDATQKPIKFSPKLPPELWNVIFVFATLDEFSSWRCRGRLAMKRSLVLVCKSWHAIALPLLYELVWMHNVSTARCCLRTLVDTATTDRSTPAGYGKWVRSIALPGDTSQDWTGFRVADILNRCPHIRVFSKGPDMNADFWHGIACTTSCLTCPTLGSFTSLRKIHWSCYDDNNTEAAAIDALRLSTLLQHAPNLTSLRILNMRQIGFSIRLPLNNPLTRLTSLQYLNGTIPSPLYLRQSDMPNLSHVTANLDALLGHDPIDGDEDHSSLLAVFGKQLRVVHLVSSRDTYDIRSILRRCPNLHAFHFNVFATVLQPENGVLHPSLSVIVLQIFEDDRLEPSLRAHIKTITGKAFPALRRVEIEGIQLSTRRFYPVFRGLLKRFPKERDEGTVAIWES